MSNRESVKADFMDEIRMYLSFQKIIVLKFKILENYGEPGLLQVCFVCIEGLRFR